MKFSRLFSFCLVVFGSLLGWPALAQQGAAPPDHVKAKSTSPLATAEPFSFDIYAHSNRIFRFSLNGHRHKELDAWARLNWKSEDVDAPDVYFWDGSADYSAFATLGNPDRLSPNFYEWNTTPSPYVQQWLPEDPTGLNLNRTLYTVEGSRGNKQFHFDLGDKSADLPKDSTVKVSIGKAEGFPETMGSPSFGPASVVIHWHSPFENTEGAVGADTDDELTLLTGGLVTMATLRDDAGVPHTPAPKAIQDVQVGDKVMVPGHPLRRVVISKETLAGGSIRLHLGLDPDDNPDDPAFDLNQQIDRIHDAHLQAQHTGAKGVKAGLEAYKALAELPFYEFGGAAIGGVLGEVGEIAEGLKAAKELERAAAEAGEVAGEERALAGELRQAAAEAVQEGKTAEAAEDVQKAEAAEKDASQLGAVAEDSQTLAAQTNKTAKTASETGRLLNSLPSGVKDKANAAFANNAELSQLTAEERELAASVYEQVSPLTVGKFKNAASLYNLERAKFLRGEVGRIAHTIVEFMQERGLSS